MLLSASCAVGLALSDSTQSRITISVHHTCYCMSAELGLHVTLVLQPLQGMAPSQSHSGHSTSTTWEKEQWKQRNLWVSAHCPLKFYLWFFLPTISFLSVLAFCGRSQPFQTSVSSRIPPSWYGLFGLKECTQMGLLRCHSQPFEGFVWIRESNAFL